MTQDKLRTYLLTKGLSAQRGLAIALGVSQSQISRLIKKLGDDVIVVGKARRTRYALRRSIEQVSREISLFNINRDGKVSKSGILIAIYPTGFIWLSSADESAKYFADLPYFLNDLRPSGFLGRLIPRTHPEWSFPPDIRLWNGDHTLRYLYNLGIDTIGNYVVGEACLSRALRMKATGIVRKGELAKYYQQRAEETLQIGTPGSSAGGEQPKFLDINPLENRSVIVKFVSTDKNAATTRRRDLLICELLAFEAYYSAKKLPPYRARLIEGTERIFLELERFDRTTQGRLGIISLFSLDNEFVGATDPWSKIAAELFRLKIIAQEHFEEVVTRELFGRFIGNSDMHPGNCSFYFEGGKVVSLAPLYDMLPMRYMPIDDALYSGDLDFPEPSPSNLKQWDEAHRLALIFWEYVATYRQVSPSFKKIAKKNLEAMRIWLDRRSAYQTLSS